MRTALIAIGVICAVVAITLLVLGPPRSAPLEISQPPAGPAGPTDGAQAGLDFVPVKVERIPQMEFGADLGEMPKFTPQVKPYTVKSDLSNVANLRLFKEQLKPEHIKAIADRGFVVVPSEWRQIEFIYEMNNYEREHLPSFVTVDSALHCFHVFYDYMLRKIEMTSLYDRLAMLAMGILRECAKQYEQAPAGEIKEAAKYNFAYAAVPVRLLEIRRDHWEVGLPDDVAELVEQELALIDKHGGFAGSPTVRLKVDYSQFVPRGHYTRNETLRRFFKVMMWYGLVPVALRNLADEFEPRLARQAIMLSQVVLNGEIAGERLIDLWEDIYLPTAFMVGFADDNTPGDFGAATAEVYGTPLDPNRLMSESDLKTLMQKVLAMRPPQITMDALKGDKTFPGIPQFRLMGQRFILDSYLFIKLIYPNVGQGPEGEMDQRWYPTGLDLMSVLGSERAFEIEDTFYDVTRFPLFESQTKKLRAEVDAYTEQDWTKTIYNGWLHTFRLLLEVKDEGYPSFMRNEGWVDKQLNAALASWAELRHDTILYAKQSVGIECGAAAEEEEPPPPPKGYVEPEVLAYWRLGLLTRQLGDGLKGRGLLTDQMLLSKFDEFATLLEFLEQVSIKELTGTALTAEEFQQIEYYGDTLARLNLLTVDAKGVCEVTSEADRDMALVADFHTATDTQKALEAAVGHANTIYAVYPLEGKLLLGRGATFDYYEFGVPMDDRLTDEKWQEMLGTKERPGSAEWMKSFLSPIGTDGEEAHFTIDSRFERGGGC